jgi:hypothetical protein
MCALKKKKAREGSRKIFAGWNTGVSDDFIFSTTLGLGAWGIGGLGAWGLEGCRVQGLGAMQGVEISVRRLEQVKKKV